MYGSGFYTVSVKHAGISAGMLWTEWIQACKMGKGHRNMLLKRMTAVWILALLVCAGALPARATTAQVFDVHAWVEAFEANWGREKSYEFDYDPPEKTVETGIALVEGKLDEGLLSIAVMEYPETDTHALYIYAPIGQMEPEQVPELFTYLGNTIQTFLSIEKPDMTREDAEEFGLSIGSMAAEVMGDMETNQNKYEVLNDIGVYISYDADYVDFFVMFFP